MNRESLYDQLIPAERDAVASLMGFNGDSSGYRNNLRDIPALAYPYTLGDAARAYVHHLLTNTPMRTK